MKRPNLQVLEFVKASKLGNHMRSNKKTESFNSSIFQQGYVWGEWGERHKGSYRVCIE